MLRPRKLSVGRKRVALFVLILFVLLVAARYWSWAEAQARAGVVLFSVLRTPVLADATRLLTPEPVVRDTTVGGSATNLEAAPIGWQLFVLGSLQSDWIAFVQSLVTYAIRLLAQALNSLPVSEKACSRRLVNREETAAP